ncbi:hypothetical protein L7F22_030048 [Adiantum nelumboides]|nr:hypothetical protein [Adiantum nelumboides]
MAKTDYARYKYRVSGQSSFSSVAHKWSDDSYVHLPFISYIDDIPDEILLEISPALEIIIILNSPEPEFILEPESLPMPEPIPVSEPEPIFVAEAEQVSLGFVLVHISGSGILVLLYNWFTGQRQFCFCLLVSSVTGLVSNSVQVTDLFTVTGLVLVSGSAVQLVWFWSLVSYVTGLSSSTGLVSAIRTTSSATSSRSTRSKKSSSDEERTDIDKEQDSQESAQEDVPKEVEATGPFEYERSDKEDTSTPLEKRSQKPRSREQVLIDEAMARVEAKRKELANARAAKASKIARLMTLEEARKIKIEKAKAIQKERRRIEAKKKAQEEAEAAQATETQEKETLSRQFKCQQVVAKETDIQKDKANRAHQEITNLRIALELVTQERDTNARENENLLRDLIDLQSQLTRKEAQNHDLIKNKKKMKEQLKYEDARFQKLNASYNTVKSTLTTLLQNQEPAAAIPFTSDSATTNTLAALQEELQTEKLQRQHLVSRFMSQTAQHEAKVKQLELELAQAKANLEAVESLASTSQIHQAESHLPIQQPLMPEMPEF